MYESEQVLSQEPQLHVVRQASIEHGRPAPRKRVGFRHSSRSIGDAREANARRQEPRTLALALRCSEVGRTEHADERAQDRGAWPGHVGCRGVYAVVLEDAQSSVSKQRPSNFSS